jgi:hypothetical protein
MCGYYLSYQSTAAHRHDAVTHNFTTDLTYYDMPRMTILLGGGAQTQVRLDLSLEVAKKDVAVVEGFQPRIADRLNGLFLHINPDDFRSSTDLPWLRQQMLSQVNNATPVPIHDLLLRQMVIM